MTIRPPAPLTGQKPSEAFAAQVNASMDLIAELDLESLCDSAQCRAALAALDALTARVAATRLRIIRHAEQARIAEKTGQPSIGAWLAQANHRTGSDAAREVRLANAVARSIPATGEALERGELSARHADIIASAIDKLPANLERDDRAAIERSLVRQARSCDTGTFARRARRALDSALSAAARAQADQHQDQLIRDEETASLERCRFQIHDNGNGTMSGSFVVPTLSGAILKKVLQQLTSPRRAHPGQSVPQQLSHDASSAHEPVATTSDWANQQGRAFAELLEHLPTDRLHGKVAATVVITMTRRQLLADLAAAGVDTGNDLSASQARRLACNAALVPAVLGGQSQPLDLGRAMRLFTDAHRVALSTQYETCAASGCDRPYAWTELHHLQPWSRGGQTNLANALPLCWFHHRRIHDPAYQHTVHERTTPSNTSDSKSVPRTRTVTFIRC